MAGIDSLILQCAPGVAPQTMTAIVQVESAGNPWQIGNNTLKRPQRPTPRNYQEAVTVAKSLISAGYNIDMGLAQINSKNLGMLNLSIEQVMEPCTNINAGSRILRNFYIQAAGKYGHGQQALYHALSGYNTGSLYAGASYVQKIINAAYKGVPLNSSPLTNYPLRQLPYRALTPRPSTILVDNSHSSEILTK